MVRIQLVRWLLGASFVLLLAIALYWPREKDLSIADALIAQQVTQMAKLSNDLGTWRGQGKVWGGAGSTPTQITSVTKSVLTPNRRAIVTTCSVLMNRSEIHWQSVTRWRTDKQEFQILRTFSKGPTVEFRMTLTDRGSNTFWKQKEPGGTANFISVSIRDSPIRSHYTTFAETASGEKGISSEGTAERVNE